MSRLPRRSICLVVLALGILRGSGGFAQTMGPPPPDASTSGGRQQQDRDDPFTLQQKKDLVKKQNELRQQEIKKDTDKLLELATELKQYVDKTNENIISLDVIKKAEQIEK